MKRLYKNSIYFLILTATSFSLQLNAQTLSDEESDLYSKLGVAVTGNATVDAQNYDAAKTLLQQQNPTLYAEYFGSPIPADYPYRAFPGFAPTGDPTVDAPKYSVAKRKLYQNNLIVFHQYFPSGNGATVKQISRQEYLALPPAKQQVVDAEGYEIID